MLWLTARCWWLCVVVSVAMSGVVTVGVSVVSNVGVVCINAVISGDVGIVSLVVGAVVMVVGGVGMVAIVVVPLFVLLCVSQVIAFLLVVFL